MEKLTLRESFTKGLRNRPYVNSANLTTCKCLRTTETGLVPFRSIDGSSLPALTGDYGAQVEYVGKNIVVVNGSGLFTTAGVAIPIYVVSGERTAYVVNQGTPKVITATVNSMFNLLIKAENSDDVGAAYTVVNDGVTVYSGTLTADYVEINTLVVATKAVTITVSTTGKAASTSYKLFAKFTPGAIDLNRLKFVEFGDVWFASGTYGGASVFIFHTPSNGDDSVVSPMKWTVYASIDSTDPVEIMHSKRVDACATHMGRLYMAGFYASAADYATTEASLGSLSWEYFWNSFLENCEIEFTHENMEIGPTTVFYSKLNGGDYFWPFAVELAMLGIPNQQAFYDAIPMLLDGVRKYEVGFFDVPTNGTILRMESMRESLVIFTTDGIYVATPQYTQAGVGHLVQRVSDIPVLSKNAVHAIGAAIYCVNKNYRLIILSPEQGIIDVDYSELLKNLDADTIRMDYDHELDDLYISSGDSLEDGSCYVLTKTGMCEYGAPVYSFVHYQGNLIGYAGDQPTQNDNVLASVVTETLDFGERMLKEAHSLEFGVENIANMRMRTLYKTNSKSGWQYTSWLNVYDVDNFSTPIVSFHDLRIELEFEILGYDADDYTRLEYLNLNWRRGDKRNFRLHRSQV